MSNQRFPKLPRPTLFLASPGDVVRFRRTAFAVHDEIRRSLPESEQWDLFAWEKVEADDPFDAGVPAQEQIPRPDDPHCRAVVAIFGEWIGRPLAANFPVDMLDALDPQWQKQPYRLQFPWEPGAEERGAFPLTGSTFEVLCAIAANRAEQGDPTRDERAMQVYVVGPQDVHKNTDVNDAGWGFGHLDETIGQQEKNLQRRMERYAELIAQRKQLRNFICYINEVRGHQTQFVADEADFEKRLRTWLRNRQRVTKSAPHLFRGLQSFDVEDAATFYGRDAAIDHAFADLRELWADEKFANLYWIRGVSGTGKSSFLRAGIVGQMQKRIEGKVRWTHCVIRPTDIAPQVAADGKRLPHQPLLQLLRQCLASILGQAEDHAQVTALLDPLKRAAKEHIVEAAGHALRQALDLAHPAPTRFVLGFDQFEEAVELLRDEAERDDWDEAIRFALSLGNDPRTMLIATLREDRMQSLLGYAPLQDAYGRTKNYCRVLELPSGADLETIIRSPFSGIDNLTIDKSFVAALVESIQSFAKHHAGDRSGSLLPLIALTLERLHRQVVLPLLEKAAAPPPAAGSDDGNIQNQFAEAGDDSPAGDSRAVLNAEACEGFLDIGDAVAQLAGEAVADASDRAGPSWEQDAIGALLRRLVRYVDPAAGTFTLPLAEPPGSEAGRQLVAAMKHRRLIVEEEQGRIRLVHESVIEYWKEAQDWLTSEEPILKALPELLMFAKTWQKGRSHVVSLTDEEMSEPAFLMLAQWFEMIEPASPDADPDNHALLRDFCLELLARRNQPAERIAGTRHEPSHLMLAAAYQRSDIVARMLEADPSAANILRNDGRNVLFFPAFQGNVALARQLLPHVKAPDAPDEHGWRVMHAACAGGSVELVRLLVEHGARLDGEGAPRQTSALHIAAQGDHRDLIAYLVGEIGMDADLREQVEQTPMMRAALENKAGAIAALGAAGGDPGAALSNGATALHLAAQYDHVAALDALLDLGAPIDAPALNDWHAEDDRIRARIADRQTTEPDRDNAEFDQTALHMAASLGKAAAVRRLVARGADVNAVAGDGATALHLAARDNRAEIAEILLTAASGARTDLIDAAGRAALHDALDARNWDVAGVLLDHGADIELPRPAPSIFAPGAKVVTPLQHAALTGDHEVAQFLLDRGCPRGTPAANGRTALHMAAQAGHRAIVRQLLAPDGAAALIPDSNGLTPIHLAASNGKVSVLDELLQRVDRATIAWQIPETPLHFAARAGQYEAIELLIDRGLMNDLPDSSGMTPLLRAAEAGHAGCVQLLYKAGGDPARRLPSSGLDALGLAARSGSLATVEVLLEDAAMDPDSGSATQPTPAAVALRYRQFDIVAALLRAGADPRAIVPGIGLPLFEAYCRLAEKGCDLGLADARHAELEAALHELGFALGLGDTDTPAAAGGAFSPGATAFYPEHCRQEGVWHEMEATELADFAQRIDPVDGKYAIRPGEATIAWRNLPWYDDVRLVSVATPEMDERNVRLFFLELQGEIFRLKGISPPIHEVNKRAQLRLDSANVLDYLRFFCFFVRGEHGPFYIVEALDDPFLPQGLGPAGQAAIADTARPATFEGMSPEGHFWCDAVVYYSNAIFITNYAIGPDGMVEMLDDEPVASDLPGRITARLS